MKACGLQDPPKLAVGDGGLGFWKALDEVFPGTRHQRCWVHKTANVLNKLPKSKHKTAKPDMQAIWMADSRTWRRLNVHPIPLDRAPASHGRGDGHRQFPLYVPASKVI